MERDLETFIERKVSEAEDQTAKVEFIHKNIS